MMYRQHFWHASGIVRGDGDERHRHRALGHPRQGARRALPPALGRAGARLRPPLLPPRRRARWRTSTRADEPQRFARARRARWSRGLHRVQVDGRAADDAARRAGARPLRRGAASRRCATRSATTSTSWSTAMRGRARAWGCCSPRRSSRTASTCSRSRAGPSASRTSPRSRRSVATPIATGERLVGVARASASCCETGACSVLQPDITHCGGLTEARRIAALAEAYRVALAPHNPQGPVSTAASLELGFATPSLHHLRGRHGRRAVARRGRRRRGIGSSPTG